MKEKYKESSKYRKRRDSSSSSYSHYSESSPKRTEQLYDSLKRALNKKDHKQIYNRVRDLSAFRDELGILRLAIPSAFSFQKADLEEFFEQYGRVQNIIIKEPKTPDVESKQKNTEKDHKADKKQLKQKDDQPETASTNIAYVIYSQEFSAIIALRVIMSAPEKQRIADAKLCTIEDATNQDQTFNPLIGQYSPDQFLIEAGTMEQIQVAAADYTYVGTIGIDLQERTFQLRDRILGAESSNFLRVLYYCEKAVRLQNEGEVSQQELILKLMCGQEHIDRTVLVMTNSVLKYNTAIRYLHELFEQIVEEYKNSKQKSYGIIPKDVHIRRWEKFRVQPTLKFLESTEDKMNLQ